MITDTAAQAAAHDLARIVGPERVARSGPLYDEVCGLWNEAVERHPALVVRCRTADEVAAAVRAAREHGLRLSVRGGGHDWAGRALVPGGLTVDLGGLRNVAVDAARGIAVIGGGARSGDVVAAAAPFGLAPATGSAGGVGYAGLALAGGYGPLCGVAGLALDTIVGAEVVLADGRVVTTDERTEPELFWALRGGGGNFGVVTSLRIRLHPVPHVLSGFLLFPWAEAGRVLERLGPLLADAPDELTVETMVAAGPGGGPALYLVPTWCGAPAAGERAVEELTRLGKPIASDVAPHRYADLLRFFDDQVVEGRGYALRTRSVPGMTPEVAAALLETAWSPRSPLSIVPIHHFHGAAARRGVAETAFGLRTPHLCLEFVTVWPMDEDPEPHLRWADTLADAVAPSALPGGYPNLLGPGEHEQIERAYGEGAQRLLAAKRRYDPDGVFSATPLPADRRPAGRA